jgi:quercetin dioxygenase-like cupin family protein
MGRVVTFGELASEPVADGIKRAAITRDETVEMAAEFIGIEPGKRWTSSAPHGSDCYLFMLNGNATISAGADKLPFPAQTFSTIQEGVEFAVANDGSSPAEIVKVLAPPQPNGRPLKGFRETISVAERHKMPVVDLPDQKKKRIYFVGDHAAKSERGHAMIVVYEKTTVTDLHYHPNAESMFVVLDGALQFTVNGARVIVKPGQAAYFGLNDRHGLHTADDCDGASFLEFHIPAAFTTVKSPALAG